MASLNPNTNKSRPLYPQVTDSHPDLNTPFLSSSSSSTTIRLGRSSSSLYPTVDVNMLAENLFPSEEDQPQMEPPVEEVLLKFPGAVLHLIDRQRSVDLGSGDFSIVRIMQGNNTAAVLAKLGETVQWPLTPDVASVKVDLAHYFFTIRVPHTRGDDEEGTDLNRILLAF